MSASSPAFPALTPTPGTALVGMGVTKREYFASAAMASLQSLLLPTTGSSLMAAYKKQYGANLSNEQVIAKVAKAQADAMLVELAIP